MQNFDMQSDRGASSSEEGYLAVIAFALIKRKKHKMWVRSAFAKKEKSCHYLIKELGAIGLFSFYQICVR